MPRDVRRHLYVANSVGSDVSKNEPKKASLNFLLSNGELLTVAVPRYILKRLSTKIDRSLKAAPVQVPRARTPKTNDAAAVGHSPQVGSEQHDSIGTT